MHVVKALDAGDVILSKPFKIAEDETASALHDRLAEAGPESLLEALELLASGADERVPQDESLMTYAPKLEREHGRIDWSQSAEQLERTIRAYHTWPGTFTTFQDGKGKEKRLKVYPPVTVIAQQGQPGQLLPITEDGPSEGIRVACGDCALVLHEVQAEGSRRMSAGDFLNGFSVENFG